MPNIASIIRDHVTLSMSCLDRLYLNGYIPKLQTSGQLCYFLTEHLGKPIPSPALLRPLHQGFVDAVRRYADEQDIPLVAFERGQRKDAVAQEHRRDFFRHEGVVFVGVAQEKARAFKARKHRTPSGSVAFDFSRQWVCVNHYYFYFQDRQWGPGFVKIGSYMPYPVKLCVNGHEWVKQQLRREGIGFESLDNGFLSCEDPDRLQEISASLGPDEIQRCFDHWSHRLPWPLDARDRAAGFEHRLSVWQAEISLTQVFDRPLYGRLFFEELLREQLDLGRPDRVCVLFPTRLSRRTPPPAFGYRTRVFTRGVEPSLHVEYKKSHVKQYFKEQHALRTETTINDPGDFRVNKGLSNLPYLRQIGEAVNQRLLASEQLSHDCLLTESALERLQRPTIEQGQRSPALRFADRRVMALLQALCGFAHLPAGFRNRQLRAQVAALLAQPDYSPGQMTYDLRRLRRKGLIARIEGTHRYILTTYGLRVALFCSKLYLRLFRPAWAALETATSEIPHRLRQAFDRVGREIDHLLDNNRLKKLDSHGTKAAFVDV